jgi:peptidyl-prolyl cis-trans isomerase NIMA-interacting 1
MRRFPLLSLVAALAFCLSACTDLTAPRGEDPAELGQLPGSRQQPQGKDDKASAEKISASHILISYKEARRAAPTITRTKDEARALAEKLAVEAKTGDFEALAKAKSDDPGSGRNGGKLGSFSRDMMTKKFSEAAFQLKVGQVSEAVETEFGFHVIKRTQ